MATYKVSINGEKATFKSKKETFTHVVVSPYGAILRKCSGADNAIIACQKDVKYFTEESGGPYIVEVEKV